MLENKTRLAFLSVLILALILVFALSVRNSNQTTSAPTVNEGEIQTKAVATFGSELTRTAEALPTSTLASTPVPSAAPINTESNVSPTPSCYRLKYLQDVTIPDYTVMKPGTSFTKTWQVENTGTCAWVPGFQFIHFGGDEMNGQPLTLTQTVQPGGRIELSILLSAPTDKGGIITSTWRMTDTNGNFFGDALSVIINLSSELPTPTP